MAINYALNIFQKCLALHGKYGCKKSSSSIIEDEEKGEEHTEKYFVLTSLLFLRFLLFSFLLHVGFHI